MEGKEIAYSVVHRAFISREDVGDGEVSAQRVQSVSLGGLLMVSFQKDSPRGNLLDSLFRTVQFPTYMGLKHWTAQVRGFIFRNDDDSDAPTLSTTTTTTTTV